MTVRWHRHRSRGRGLREIPHDGDLSSHVQTATQEIFAKAVTAKYTAPDLIAQRPRSPATSTLYRGETGLYGAQVINIDMRNFASPIPACGHQRQGDPEQLRLAAENKLKTVELSRSRKWPSPRPKLTRAKGAGRRGGLRQPSASPGAQAEALRVQNAALAQNKDVLELRRIEVEKTKAEKWNGACRRPFTRAP